MVIHGRVNFFVTTSLKLFYFIFESHILRPSLLVFRSENVCCDYFFFAKLLE